MTASILAAESNQIVLNGRPVLIEPVQSVIDSIAPQPVALFFETPLPIGCGFGVSAACCLTAAFAIAKRFDLELSRPELGLVAHQAEVRHRTGVGDVASQLTGGIVYRKCRQGPLDAVPLPVPRKPLYYRVFGEIRTSAVLQNLAIMKVIGEEGEKAIRWLETNLSGLTIESLLERSLAFAINAGLFTDRGVQAAIESVGAVGGRAAMVMLGQSVLATCPATRPEEWTRCEVDESGTRWLT